MSGRSVLAMLVLAGAGGCGLVGYGDDGADPDLACYQSIAVGTDHACAVNRAGALYCWGADEHGQVTGTPGGARREAPVPVTLPSSAVAVAAGKATTCAILDDNRLWCWGAERGAAVDYPRPTRLELDGDVYRVGLGEGYGCAKVGPDDHVACWGIGDLNRLGQSDDTWHQTPVIVPGPIAVAALAIGQRTACAVQGDGQVWCWGDNRRGQLGFDSNDVSRGATLIPALAGAERVAMGEDVGCSFDDDVVRCWGGNDLGQLGTGDVGADQHAPSLQVASEVYAVEAMGDAACTLGYSGAMKCWGRNRAGQLGQGDLEVRAWPTDVAAMHGARSMAGGPEQICAEKDDALWCWGANLQGQLGRGTHASVRVPQQLASGTRFESVRGGGGTLCAVDDAQQLWCWGDGERGQAGLGGRRGSAAPVMIQAGVSEVAVGILHGCARGASTLWCWGDNMLGQLGDPAAGAGVLAPRPIIDALPITAVAAGDGHTCAIAGGTLKCWGANGNGQVGDGGLAPQPRPVPIAVANPTAVAAGAAHTCARDDSARLWCWGSGGAGQLGDGMGASSSTPVEVIHPNSRGWRQVAAGREHTCALDKDDVLWCWGSNALGQLGSAGAASPIPREIDWPAASRMVMDVFVDRDTTCAVLTTGEARCWGADATGALGVTGTAPQAFGAVADITAFGGGPDTLCAINGTGELWCAGAGTFGQLGADLVGWQPQSIAVPCE